MGDTLSDLPQPEYEGAVDPDSLETDGDNPNEMSDEQFGLLCDRMRQNGWLGGPIITDTDGLIADGQHRWQAAQEIGLTEVPVKQYEIDDATRRLWRQELNKIHGEHDTKRDALEYDYLLDNGKTDEVQALTNAAGEDLDELLAEIKMDSSRPAVYEYDTEHNVYFEDCVEGMKERLEDDSVDLLIADPPYGVDYDGGTKPRSKLKNDNVSDQQAFVYDFLVEAARVVKPGSAFYIFSPPDALETDFRNALSDSPFEHRQTIAWAKNNATFGPPGQDYHWKHETILYGHLPGEAHRFFGNRKQETVWEYDRPAESEDHPTMKPIPLITNAIENSTLKGDRILDPFMGSGTTAVAAIQNDRDYVGFELDEDNYRSVIERRIGEAKRQVEANQD